MSLFGCAECIITFDTTLAYDEAEQAEKAPSSTPVSSSVSPSSTADDSDEVPEPSTRELELLTPPSCQSLDSDTTGEGDNWEPGPPSSQPFVSSFADTKVKEATDLFLMEEELGLDKLFKETVHVHAQKPQVPQESANSKREARGPNTKKRESPPVETVTRVWRRRKIPSYLQDYHV